MANVRPSAFGRVLGVSLISLSAATALAQDSRQDAVDVNAFGLPIPTEFKSIDERYPGLAGTTSAVIRGTGEILGGVDNSLPNIMLTGYWPPTNEMLRQWSTNPAQNPGGWVGENWEGRGYNVYAFFPEFPNGVGRGEGDFEVDYQDSSGDWWLITSIVKPVGIITFSRAGFDFGWEMEGGNRVYPIGQWTNDYLDPRQPTPELPSSSEPNFNERFSSQPMQEIVDAVNAQVAGLNAFIEPIDNGRFLSNYIGYHGNWYKDLHDDPLDPDWCVTGGHIHVGYRMTNAQAVAASEVTLRVVLDAVDERRAIGDLNCDGVLSVADIGPFVLALTDPAGYAAQFPDCDINRGDLNSDTVISVSDIGVFVALLTS